jgi:NTP pyrophosphatase (non-canonical NTP hydrolase)
MMNDATTTLTDLKKIVATFVDERDWNRFHSPKNVAASVCIEAAELLEHFQWLEADQCERNALSPEKLNEIGEECADVLAYLLSLANRLDLDLADVLERKMKRNAEKYPIEQFYGRSGNK